MRHAEIERKLTRAAPTWEMPGYETPYRNLYLRGFFEGRYH